MNSARMITAIALEPKERWAFAGTLGGHMLAIDVDAFSIASEVWAHAGHIEAVTVHRALPYFATLGGDETVCIFRYREAEARKIHSISLREIRAENDYDFRSSGSFSRALSFHPDRPTLLTRNVSGATVELEFDDRSQKTLWCRGFFRTPDGGQDIAYVRYLVDSQSIFCSGRGGLVVVDPANRSEPALRWSLQGQSIRYAEHLERNDYLLTSDSRRVVRFDVTKPAAVTVGPKIMRDTPERVVLNRRSGRAFCASRDRTVVEIDPVTCESKGVLVTAPFPCRWLETFERAPELLLLQCRGGALYKIDLSTKRVTGKIREPSSALWAGVIHGAGNATFAGDGAAVLQVAGAERPRLAWSMVEANPSYFTNCIAYHRPSESLLLGRTDGAVVVVGPAREPRGHFELPAAVRDIAVSSVGSSAFAVCEDGSAHRLDLDGGHVLARWRADEPLWCAAFNAERGLLAVGGRDGGHFLLDSENMSLRYKTAGDLPPRRLRWIDADRLLILKANVLSEMHVQTREKRPVLGDQASTIEDFAWTSDRRYLALCNYHRQVRLLALPNWSTLHEAPLDMESPTGLAWSESEAGTSRWPYELLVWGLSGAVHRFRVHDDRLVAVAVMRPPPAPIVEPDRSIMIHGGNQ